MARIPRPNLNKPQLETYNASHGTYAIYSALPSKLTTVYGLLIGGSISSMAYYAGDNYGDGRGQLWLGISMGVMTLVSVVAVWLRARKLKKEAATAGSFEDAIKNSAAGWDTGGGSDPAEIARLDNLRKQFQKGIDTFKEYGKDFYSLPWYVMVGEPGSGKTEAIRHSDLRFPETLQDMLQGTGGTYSMDWWFTNQAVILDTAGAMLMNPEATQRFEEFMKLLRSFRPDCPVNGIILAIPVDSLLADNPSVLEEKAKRIARQFGVIQKALDVRFPIYLMVTKSDRLPGWREFTDAPGQQTFDREMLGWSNPADLDTPFDPAVIAGALESIAWRLDGRRLALISDPIARQPGVRRIDEVDSLFAFPETIRSLQPRLQRYLEIIFQTGTWATLPPFFRGVYFTSAMNEGAALDEQLAAALGMPIETLPGGGLFNRDKSVYLRDMFTEKVFKERGLVTRLKDIGRALRRKLVWFYATTAALLAILFLLAWMTKRNVETALKDEQENWRAANALWANGSFFPIVLRKAGDGAGADQQAPKWAQAWSGENARIWKQIGESGNGTSAPEFLEYLEKRTRNGLGGAGIFRILGPIKDLEKRRRVACMAVYEGCVLKPVLEGVREKLVWDCRDHAPRDPANDQRLASAYAALVKVEAAARLKSLVWEKKDYLAVLEPMLVYLCPDENGPSAANAASQFADIASLLYGGRIFGKSGDDGIGSRAWLATGDEAAGTAPGVLAITTGINAILGSGGVGENASLTEEKKKRLTAEKDAAVKLFEETEDQLAKLDAASATRDRVKGSLDSLKTHLASIDKARSELGDANRLAVMSPADLRDLCDKLIEALKPISDSSLPPFLQRVMERATARIGTLPKAVTSTDAADQPADPKAKVIAPEDAAKIRYDLYEERFRNTARLQSSQAGAEMIGRLQLEVDGIDKKVAEAKAAAGDPKYDGPRKEECNLAAKAIDLCMGEIAVTSLLDAYAVLLKKYLDPILYFPLVKSTKALSEAEFRAALESLTRLEKDRAYFMDAMPPAYRTALGAKTMADTFGALGDAVAIAKAVNPANKTQDGGDGLFVQRGPVAAPEKRPDPNAPAPAPAPPIIDPRFPPPPVPPQPVPEAEFGVFKAEVSQNGFPLIGGPGQKQKEKIHPGQQLRFNVQHRPKNALRVVDERPVVIPANATEPWGVVRWMSERENRNFPVGPVTFGLDSSPPLPSPKAWPQRSTFGLP